MLPSTLVKLYTSENCYHSAPPTSQPATKFSSWYRENKICIEREGEVRERGNERKGKREKKRQKGGERDGGMYLAGSKKAYEGFILFFPLIFKVCCWDLSADKDERYGGFLVGVGTEITWIQETACVLARGYTHTANLIHIASKGRNHRLHLWRRCALCPLYSHLIARRCRLRQSQFVVWSRPVEKARRRFSLWQVDFQTEIITGETERSISVTKKSLLEQR